MQFAHSSRISESSVMSGFGVKTMELAGEGRSRRGQRSALAPRRHSLPARGERRPSSAAAQRCVLIAIANPMGSMALK